VIPYARGSVRSRAVADVLAEAKGLLDQGFKELVLTGINAALYGTESGFEKAPDGMYGIEWIIKEINDLPGDFRIRLSSLEPAVVNAEYVKNLMKYEKLCPHLHLSAQSGSDAILKSMNRPYDRKDYLEIVSVLKEFDPEYGISTDLIVGFPGETEENFQDSVKLVEEVGFCKVHAFKYSQRPMTKAATMKDQIAPPVKKVRSQVLMEAGELASQRFYEANRGKVRTVLIEEYLEDIGCMTGYTDNYIRVYINGNKSDLINTFCSVKLEESFMDGMSGTLNF
jgi:threonylcarbamoyladenosine tRNA methylthiotransferase MtaB